MGYFVSDRIGLSIAALNTATAITLVYVFVKAVEVRSRLYQALDVFYGPFLSPLRRVLPAAPLDIAALVFAAVLQVAAFVIKRHWL